MRPGVLGKAGVCGVSMAVGWFTHCLLTDVRYQAGPSTAYLHAAALGAFVLLGILLDRNG